MGRLYKNLTGNAIKLHVMKLPAASYGVSKRNPPKFSFLQQAAGYLNEGG